MAQAWKADPLAELFGLVHRSRRRRLFDWLVRWFGGED